MAVHDAVLHRIAPSDPLSGYRWSTRVLQSIMLSERRIHFENLGPKEPRGVPLPLGLAGAIGAIVGVGGAILAMILDVPGLHGIAGLGLIGLTLAGLAYRSHEKRAGR